jgi:hypothetical protein
MARNRHGQRNPVPRRDPFGTPLPGPFDRPPNGIGLIEAGEMLHQAVDTLAAAGITLGTCDRQVLDRLTGLDCSTVAVLASVLQRAATRR